MRRKRFALILAALALMAGPVATFAADPIHPAYGGPLTGAQENPAVAGAATGQGTVVISADASTITYLVTYSGLAGTANAAHIHSGAVGSNGGVILPLVVGPSPFSGTLSAADFKASGAVTTFAQAVAAIRAGTTCFNIHTTANPGGEIRGQIGVTVGSGPSQAVKGRVIGSLGTLLVAAANDLTLYTFTNDVPASGTSVCKGECLIAWPALIVPSGSTPTGDASVTGELGTIIRDDNGQTQVTYDGWPLYFLQGDKAPGDTTGIYPDWEAIVLAQPPADPTIPPTSVASPIAPVVPVGSDALGILVLIGLLAGAGAFAWLGRRRSTSQL